MTTKELRNYRAVVAELTKCDPDSPRYAALQAKRDDILSWVYNLDELTCMIFKERYIEPRKDGRLFPPKWEQVSESLHYSESYIKNLHTKALKESTK